MIRAPLLLLLGALLLVPPPVLAEPVQAEPGFSDPRTAEVIATGLAFIAPRALDPVSVAQLTVWGLRGLTALDPELTVQLRDGRLLLTAQDRILATRPAPNEPDVDAWAEATGALASAAWAGSAAVRRAGPRGIIRSFFDELFNHLDPYSRYAPPEEAEQDRARRSGESGAGLKLVQRGGTVLVHDVAADGPADEAGIRPGEAVLAVDDQPTQGHDAATVAGWIRGAEDTAVTLRLRGRNGHARSVPLIREVVPPETVFAERSKGMLVLRITAFSRGTDRRMASALAQAMEEAPGRRSPLGIVLDLRGNRGGLLRQAAAATETLLSDGVIAITMGRNPGASHVWRADGPALVDDLPIVVVVDGRSASAAEIMAAALADHGRAVVVGSSTLGKGLVQTITPLPDGGELFVTWSRVLAPRGWPIQGLGVLPQVCTSFGQGETERQMAALSQGQAPMRQAVARARAARAPLPVAEMLDIRSACPAAEGRDADMAVARFLLSSPIAYAAALLPPIGTGAAGGP